MIKRNVFFRINRFQRSILFYLFALALACIILMLLFLSYLYADINNFMHTFPFRVIKVCIIASFPLISILLLIVYLHMYKLTSRIFGPYERVVREIDELLETYEKKEVVVREDDEMFKELLQRINALVRRLP